MTKEFKALSQKKSAVKDLKKDLSTFKTKVIGEKELKAAGKKLAKSLVKKFPRLPDDWKTSTQDILQKDAKKYHPPSSSIWRSNFVGSWQIHVAGHKRHSERWACYDNNIRKAMWAAVKVAWSQWLEDNSLEEAQCPIEGLFA